jgi:methionyl-tRNA formyltransferase
MIVFIGTEEVDTTKRLMSSPKYKSVEVINNPTRPRSKHREINCINYK